MKIRFLCIIGAAVLLGLGGCVAGDYDDSAYHRGYGYYGYDPWYYGPYPGYHGYYPYGGHYYHGPYYRYPYPVIIDKRHDGKRHDGRFDRKDAIGKTPRDGRGKGDGISGKPDGRRDDQRPGFWRYERFTQPPAVLCRGPKC